jgi:hypothetical protein
MASDDLSRWADSILSCPPEDRALMFAEDPSTLDVLSDHIAALREQVQELCGWRDQAVAACAKRQCSLRDSNLARAEERIGELEASEARVRELENGTPYETTQELVARVRELEAVLWEIRASVRAALDLAPPQEAGKLAK